MAKDEYQELLELREVVKEQKQQIEKLQSHVENLTQAILHSQKKMFSSSSEKTPVEGQISLFKVYDWSRISYELNNPLLTINSLNSVLAIK